MNPLHEKEYDESIELALKHLTQLKLYLYVYLNAALVLVIELFEEQTLNVDLNAINDGSFFKEYTRNEEISRIQIDVSKGEGEVALCHRGFDFISGCLSRLYKVGGFPQS